MAIFRMEKTGNYTVMFNHHLRNANLSLRAMGLFSYMLSKPDTWDFTIEGIASQCRDGKDSIRTTIKELIKNGYVARRKRKRDEKGLFRNAVYDVYENPYDNPDFVAQTSAENNPEIRKTSSSRKEVAVIPQENITLPNVENYVENLEENSQTVEITAEYAPETVSPVTEYPTAENPTLENPPLINTHNKINTDLLNNHTSINQTKNYVRESSTDVIDEMEYIKTFDEVSEQVEADILCCNNPQYRGEINEIINVITEAFTTKSPVLRVCGNDWSADHVRKRLSMLKCEHIEYVLDCVYKSSSAIQHRRNYLLTCLYNAPVTIDGYYTNLVAHDMAVRGNAA